MTIPAPTTNRDIAYTHRVLAVFASDAATSLWWRVDGDYAPITFFVHVSDVFRWDTADLERIDPVDVPLLEKTAADIQQIGEGEAWIAELYAARKRKERPQHAFYHHIPAALHGAFDVCGPRRPATLTNATPCHFPRRVPLPEV